MDIELQKAIATELVNCRINRNGSPNVSNALDILPDHLRAEVMEDAGRVVEVIAKFKATYK